MTAIAIVGLACELPDAASPEQLWENVLARRRAFRTFPAERLSLSDYWSADRLAPDALYATEAALVEGYAFDRVRFRVPGAAFRAADPAHWLALDVACRALDGAGFADGDGLPRETTGVVLGNTLTGEHTRAGLMRLRWPYVRRVVDATLREHELDAALRRRLLEAIETTYKRPFEPIGDESLAGALSNTIAGRICNHLDLGGGGYTVDAACAASLLAVITACERLSSGDLDVAVAGGVDVSLDPFELVGFAKTGALAADDMLVYDARSQGFWPGEGSAFVVLMREADARARGARVHAVIRGWGVSSDGRGGITRPEVAGQVRALRRAYARAGVDPAEVAYFEGHGTGTAVGDATELRAVTTVRAGASPDAPPAAIGSIKGNLGHTKAAAGVTGLLKATLAVREGVIPPMTGCRDPHPELLGSPALRVADAGEPWPDGERVAGVSAMGFGGINTHLVLAGDGDRDAAHAGDADDSGARRVGGDGDGVPLRAGVARRVAVAPSAGGDGDGVPLRAGVARRAALSERERLLLRSAQDCELFLLSGADRGALADAVARLRERGGSLSRAQLADAARVLADAAGDGPMRAAVVASRAAELTERLDELTRLLAAGSSRHVGGGVFLGSGRDAPRIGLLLPGQASPVRGPGALGRRFPFARERLQVAVPADDRAPVDTAVAQPAIVAASLATLDVLRAIGLEADVAVGHSLGELTALVWAGVLQPDAGQRLAAGRGRAMSELGEPGGAMAGLRLDRAAAERLAEGLPLVTAGVNAPDQTVLSGPADAVAALLQRAAARGVTAALLPVSHAFHSPGMAPAEAALAALLARERFAAPQRRIVSTVTGAELTAADDLRALLCRQLTAPVRFLEAVTAAAGGLDLLIEAGPGRVLTGLAESFLPIPAIAVDAGGPSLAGLLAAAGSAWALGAPLHLDALFGDRFTRPIDLDSPPQLFTNPCEQAPRLEDAAAPAPRAPAHKSADGAEAPAPAARAVVEEAATPAARGVAAEAPSPAPRSVGRGRAVIGEVGAAAPLAAGRESAAAAAEATAPAPLALDRGSAVAEEAPRDRLELVRELVAARAELPVAAVTADSRLLDDLHLNSIVVSELAVEVARRLGLPPPLAPNALANATVAMLADAVSEAGADAPAVSAEAPGAGPWTRAFAMVDVPRPRRGTPPQPDGGRWRVVAPRGYALAPALERALAADRRSGAALCLPEELDERNLPLFLEAARLAIDTGRLLVLQSGGGGTGFAAALHLESPDVATCVVDAPADERGVRWAAEEAAAHATGFLHVRYDAEGVRHEPELRHLPVAEGEAEGEALGPEGAALGPDGEALGPQGAALGPDGEGLRPDRAPLRSAGEALGPRDVLLVAGGAKGIAAECALALAGESGAAVAFLGRSDPSRDAALTANLARLKARYVRADVTDPAAVRAAVTEVERTLGPVTALLFAAGRNEPALLSDLDDAAVAATVAPKVTGLRNTLAALERAPLRLLVTLGSVIGRAGLRGEAHYALANEWQTRLTERFARANPACRCLAFESSVWSSIGMGERLGSIEALARQGVEAIAPEAGASLLARLTTLPDRPVAVVAAGRLGGLPTLRREREELPLRRFLERPLVHYPGIELVADAELSPELDPYLDDHVLDGERLLPAVLGLEAMAQAVTALVGADAPPTFDDVRFERPIVVPPGERTTLRVAALADDAGGGRVVLRSGRTGFQVDHFAARWRPAAPIPDTPPPPDDNEDGNVPLDPAELYGSLLFQGPRFRRLRRYLRLSATECSAEVETKPPSGWFGMFLPQELVLGDPGARDAVLHVLQACVPQTQVVPASIERLALAPRRAADGPLLVHARERTREDGAFTFDIVVRDATGAAVERWDGVRLRAVAPAARTGPWPEPLLANYLERRLEPLDGSLRVAVTTTDDRETPRRERSNAALQGAMGRPLDVVRRPDGRPLAQDAHVSTAHANGVTLAVTGDMTVTCDIEEAVARPADVWRDLLGSARSKLSETLAADRDEDLDVAATRVWAATECLQKAGEPITAPLTVAATSDDGWLLLASGERTIATYVTRLRTMDRPVTVAVLAGGGRPARL
jgi:enediyne polyketide synthase